MGRMVGRILCISEDGGPQFTVNYNVPHAIRDAEIFTENGVYYQNHQESDGRWVYKYLRPLADRPTERDLTDYLYATDPTWDGPRSAPPIALWSDLDRKFEGVLAAGGSVPAQDVQTLFELAHAAFHKLPVPKPIEVVVPVIAEVVVPPTPVTKPLQDKES